MRSRTKMDALSQLNRIPHLLSEVLGGMSIPALLEAEKVSQQWKHIISTHNIWKEKWQSSMVSPTWKLLAVRLEHTNPALLAGTKESREGATYREACASVQQDIGGMERCRMKTEEVCNLSRAMIGAGIRANERNVYIGDGTRVIVVNRWTRQVVPGDSKHHFPFWIQDFQLNDRYIFVQSNNGSIVIKDLSSYEQIQEVSDFFDDYPFPTGFRVAGDILINSMLSIDLKSLMVVMRRWDPSAVQFGPAIDRAVVIDDFEMNLWLFSSQIYLHRNLLVADAYSKDGSKRMIKIIDLDSDDQLVRQKTFDVTRISSDGIKQECHSGVIIVEAGSKCAEHCQLAEWNVEEDTIRPVCSLPSKPNSFDAFGSFVLDEGLRETVNFRRLPIDDWRSCKNSAVKAHLMAHTLPRAGGFNQRRNRFYFDGVQFFWISGTKLNLIEFCNWKNDCEGIM